MADISGSITAPAGRWFRYEVTFTDGVQYVTHGRDQAHAMSRLRSYLRDLDLPAGREATRIENVGTVKAP